MAQATATHIPIQPQYESEITLVLSPEEAAAMHCILQLIGGETNASIRRYLNSISYALNEVKSYVKHESCGIRGQILTNISGITCIQDGHNSHYFNKVVASFSKPKN